MKIVSEFSDFWKIPTIKKIISVFFETKLFKMLPLPDWSKNSLLIPVIILLGDTVPLILILKPFFSLKMPIFRR